VAAFYKDKGIQKVNSTLHKLTRYTNPVDENTFPIIYPKLSKVGKRVDGEFRLASPFEHVCGGAAWARNDTCGNDGPTQYISFSNSGLFPEVAEDCTEPWDKGGRRVIIDVQSVYRQRGLVFDLSTRDEAFKWCYEGGCVKTAAGREICFQGARDVKPWSYKCARSTAGLYKHVDDPEWWTPTNREYLGKKCMLWATATKEVLVLPDPDQVVPKKSSGLAPLEVASDRDPVPDDRLCLDGLNDRCVSFDKEKKKVVCCSQPNSPTPCFVTSDTSHLC